jgi:hypothetical protein
MQVGMRINDGCWIHAARTPVATDVERIVRAHHVKFCAAPGCLKAIRAEGTRKSPNAFAAGLKSTPKELGWRRQMHLSESVCALQ